MMASAERLPAIARLVFRFQEINQRLERRRILPPAPLVEIHRVPGPKRFIEQGDDLPLPDQRPEIHLGVVENPCSIQSQLHRKPFVVDNGRAFNSDLVTPALADKPPRQQAAAAETESYAIVV